MNFDREHGPGDGRVGRRIGRRVGNERRSGVDARGEDEKNAVGERRSGLDRRSGSNRRAVGKVRPHTT